MRFVALACDYDGTLAHDGRVNASTLAAMERLLASGRKFILVTGRELDELLGIFPEANMCERIVAENGALLYRPGSHEEKPLGERPPERFVQLLRERGLDRVSVGRVIVATWEPYEKIVLETIRDLGLEMQVIFNKGAVMVLPAGVNKASGLAAALAEMELSPHNVVGVGDAENDHAFLDYCECSAAVANALPALKERACLVTRGDHGNGVSELIDALVADDLQSLVRQPRHPILVGTRDDHCEFQVSPQGANLLLAGTSGSGKSTLATGLLERLAAAEYQFCVVDPEGDYANFPYAVPVGSQQSAPTVEEIMQLLKNPMSNAIVCLVGLPIVDRPSFFLTLLPRLQEMRARTGRPHWLVVDESHHLLPSGWEPAASALPHHADGLMHITVHPGMIARSALESVSAVLVVGKEPGSMLAEFCQALDAPSPNTCHGELEPGEALVWQRRESKQPFKVRIAPGKTEHRRHTRKYAEGALPPDRSFYFRGPDGKLNLRAQNLILFLQLADGVDDGTWLHHLHRGDYSRWFRAAIKDEVLAGEAVRIEAMSHVSPRASRDLIRQLIESHYTLPDSPPLPIPGTDAAPVRS